VGGCPTNSYTRTGHGAFRVEDSGCAGCVCNPGYYGIAPNCVQCENGYHTTTALVVPIASPARPTSSRLLAPLTHPSVSAIVGGTASATSSALRAQRRPGAGPASRTPVLSTCGLLHIHCLGKLPAQLHLQCGVHWPRRRPLQGLLQGPLLPQMCPRAPSARGATTIHPRARRLALCVMLDIESTPLDPSPAASVRCLYS
jgi:hypothetical protein